MTFGRALCAANTSWSLTDQKNLQCQSHNKNKKGGTSLVFLPGSSEDTSLHNLVAVTQFKGEELLLHLWIRLRTK